MVSKKDGTVERNILDRDIREITLDTKELDEDDGESVLEVILPPAPDGGWGWMIVLASLVANIIVDGITYTFGIFLPRFEEAFQQPKSTIALAGSLQVGTYLCAGPIVSALTNRFGCKRVTIAGSIIASFAFIISMFSPSADILILTYGIIGGLGFGMMYLPAIVIVGYYFEKKRALATGIAVCGSGVGMFLMAPLSDYLLSEFGLRGALLVQAGLILNGVVCGMLMRPLAFMESPERQPVTAAGQQFSFSSVPNIVFSSTRTSDKGGSMRHTPIKRATSHNFTTDKILLRHVGKEVTPEVKQPAQKPIGLSFIGLSDFSLNKVRERTHLPLSRRDITISGGSVLHIPEHSVQESYIRSLTSIKSQGAMSIKSEAERILCSCLPESVRETLLQMLDFSIMKNKAYVFILIGNICAMLGFYVPFVFIPERAMKLGFSEDKAAFLLSIIGITNTVGRVLTGVLANLNKIDSLVINNIAMLLCGVTTFIYPFCQSYELLCFIAAVFGLSVAAYISLSSILLCDMLGVEQLTNAFGFLTLARGVSSCAGSPLAGAIIDKTGDIGLAFYVGGGMIALGGLFHCMLHTLASAKRNRTSQPPLRWRISHLETHGDLFVLVRHVQRFLTALPLRMTDAFIAAVVSEWWEEGLGGCVYLRRHVGRKVTQ
ncbi:hypothetical protein C0Q70_12542 [Pomacea canaliculata]|uniref:Major facilitator superfamily (MFS) profile domain-containing protein n=1 Tax=Pomacea canaliculata TaxID=400727 RepID=A0A2T7P1U7_POMCA|nr:hypothetical protein C0Q70_12542 [Pomacea canaliculata]